MDHVLPAGGSCVIDHGPLRSLKGSTLRFQAEGIASYDRGVTGVANAVSVAVQLIRVVGIRAVVGTVKHVAFRSAAGRNAVVRITVVVSVQVGVIRTESALAGIIWITIVGVKDAVVVDVFVAKVSDTVSIRIRQVTRGRTGAIVQSVYHVSRRGLTRFHEDVRITETVVVRVGVEGWQELLGIMDYGTDIFLVGHAVEILVLAHR